jgi:uncharacterized protein (TIGR03437 family)
MELQMSRKSNYFSQFWVIAFVGTVLAASTALSGTFGTVVPIGGEAADIALDQSRGVLYIANFTANTIDVMTLANHFIQTSINVDAQPSSISVSPDYHWLLVAHYGNNAAPASQTNELTLIDLTAGYAQQNFVLANPPLGVAFGLDGNALVVTSQEFILFNPALGTTQLLQTIAQVATNAIPQPLQSFPGNITQASIATSMDGMTIAGFGGTSPYLLFRFSVANHTVYSSFYTSTPAAGPRTVSVADDGSQMSFAWWTSDPNFITMSEFNSNPNGPLGIAGLLNIGSSIIDSSRGLIYAHIPPAGTSATNNTNTPILQILSADNLSLIDQMILPENLAGKSVISSDHNTVYSISDSGVMVLPVGNLSSAPRLTSSVQDLVFRGNFCNRASSRQTFTITDPGGGNTAFSISSSTPGLTVSPTSGITPAVITVSVNPNAFSSQKGTVTAALPISSTVATNLPQAIRVLINSEDVSQRGNFVDIPGRIVDVLADPSRGVYYLLRQDQNQLLVFDGNTNLQTATLRTCTTPTSMAMTFDQQFMLVGCNNSHYISVFDLDLLQAQPPITSNSDYVQSIAVSSNVILATTRSAADGSFGVDNVDTVLYQFSRLPSLGVYSNGTLASDTAMAASSNGANILIAGADGSVLLYNSNANSFTVSRKDFTSLAGSFAASSFNQFLVQNHLLDASGVKQMDLPDATGNPSGFAFVDLGGYFTTAPSVAAPGVIAQVNLSTGGTIQPTAMIEAPLLSPTFAQASNGTTCTTTTTPTSSVETCTTITGTVISTNVTTCAIATAGTSSTSTCTSTGTTGSTPTGAPPNAFTRSLAPLPSRTAIVSLTTSGFTVLPWSYAASVAPPTITSIVSAADHVSPAAPGGLISVLGSQLSATNLATGEIPLPTALANSCLTVNGEPTPLIFVSPNQINAQMPSQALGDVTVQVHTPGGISPNFNMIVEPAAPAVFLSGVAGPVTNLPLVIRTANNLLVTDTNPVHRGDTLSIFLTGCGNTTPSVADGQAAPSNPMAVPVITPTVSLGNQSLNVLAAGMAAGQVGVCQFNVTVPNSTPEGLGVPLTITQAPGAQTLNLRVVD